MVVVVGGNPGDNWSLNGRGRRGPLGKWRSWRGFGRDRRVHETMVMAQGARTGGSRRLWVVTAQEEGGCGVGGQSR